MKANWNIPTETPDNDFDDVCRIDYLPTAKSIPMEFIKSDSIWIPWVSEFISRKVERIQIPIPKEGINLNAAVRHMILVMEKASMFPTNNCEIYAIAYLASLWFEEPD